MKKPLNFTAMHYTIIIGRNWIYHAELCEELDILFPGSVKIFTKWRIAT